MERAAPFEGGRPSWILLLWVYGHFAVGLGATVSVSLVSTLLPNLVSKVYVSVGGFGQTVAPPMLWLSYLTRMMYVPAVAIVKLQSPTGSPAAQLGLENCVQLGEL